MQELLIADAGRSKRAKEKGQVAACPALFTSLLSVMLAYRTYLTPRIRYLTPTLNPLGVSP